MEHPYRLSRFRLQSEKADPLEAAQADPAAPLTEVWTDGSVMWPHHFWLTTAAYSVIGASGNVISSGRVKHWGLSSYVAELWAIRVALQTTPGPLQVYCDNQAVVRNIESLITTGQVGARTGGHPSRQCCKPGCPFLAHL